MFTKLGGVSLQTWDERCPSQVLSQLTSREISTTDGDLETPGKLIFERKQGLASSGCF